MTFKSKSTWSPLIAILCLFVLAPQGHTDEPILELELEEFSANTHKLNDDLLVRLARASIELQEAQEHFDEESPWIETNKASSRKVGLTSGAGLAVGFGLMMPKKTRALGVSFVAASGITAAGSLGVYAYVHNKENLVSFPLHLATRYGYSEIFFHDDFEALIKALKKEDPWREFPREVGVDIFSGNLARSLLSEYDPADGGNEEEIVATQCARWKEQILAIPFEIKKDFDVGECIDIVLENIAEPLESE